MNSVISPVRYNEFSERLHARTSKRGTPITGSLEFTMRCNLRCPHCYCSSDSAKNEMDTQKMYRVIDEIAEAGCLWLLITGGEPLVRDDFTKIYRHAKERGMIITLFTNGTLLTPYLADFLKEYAPFSIEISLYGVTRKTYEAVTCVNGSFEKCMRGIALVEERGLSLKLKTTVTTSNRSELDAIKEFAKGRGIAYRFDGVLQPKIDGARGPLRHRLSPREIVELDTADNERYNSWREACERLGGMEYPEKSFSCEAGRASFHIDPYGMVRVCDMVRHPSYDLAEESFEASWSHLSKYVAELAPQKKSRCSECRIHWLCDQCPGWAELEKNDAEEPVDYLCEIAHRRAEALKGCIKSGAGGDFYEPEEEL